MANNSGFDVDFSLAMHNRTGKYFIGRDLLDCASDLLGESYYWRVPRKSIPGTIESKIFCKIQGLQIRYNAAGGLFGHSFRPVPPKPLLHLEPYTVLGTRLRREDAVIVHDIGPVTHPELFDPKLYASYKKIFAELEEIGPHLIFVSEASQREFERVYPRTRAASSTVLYPAIRAAAAAAADEPVPGLSGPFLLTAGSIGDRKNQLRCIEAFAKSGLAARGVTYVLCGATEQGHEAVTAAAAATDGVMLLSYVSDNALAWLYANARGFVLASLLEGFGMPLAEAIGHGTIPAITENSVLEEVAGEGALTCDPLSVDSIMRAMVGLIDMPEPERAARLVRLRASIERFSLAKFCHDWRAALIAMRPA